MKKVLILLSLVGFVGCSENNDPASILNCATKGLNCVDKNRCTVLTVDGGSLIECSDGTSSFIENGKDGKDGIDGTDGADGIDGTDGADGIDGTDGADGIDGTDGVSPVLDMIDPCGDNPDEFDEIILVLADGVLLAYFEDGNKRFLSQLVPGKYITTDKQKCLFTVTEEMEVIWQ